MSIRYLKNTATQKEIFIFLSKCDKLFIPKLSQRVNIREYSQKLFENAVHFEAWDRDVLIGLISMYINSKNIIIGYISSVGVLSEYANNGIASSLLTTCIKYSINKNLDNIQLEVNKKNFSALSLYKKFKFKVYEESNNSLMKLNLSSELQDV